MMRRIQSIILLLVFCFCICFAGCGKKASESINQEQKEENVSYVNQNGKPLVTGDYDYSAISAGYDYTVKDPKLVQDPYTKTPVIYYAGIEFEEDFRDRHNNDRPASGYYHIYKTPEESKEAYDIILKQMQEDFGVVVDEESQHSVYFDDGVILRIRRNAGGGAVTSYLVVLIIEGDMEFEKVKVMD